MKILHIIPGSGGSFYCGNCLRDSKFVIALRESEHEAVKLPMYLPLFADEHDLQREIPVFYGAISIYMKQMFPAFRKAPRWVDKFFNSKMMLKVAARFAGSTRAKGLEEMTVSMLLGEEGQQKEELEYMVDWISEHCKPDVIHLSNALLIGLAHRLKEKVNAPVICSLQDEDVWVDVMKPEVRDEIWELMSKGGEHVSSFVSVSDYYAREMKKKMHLPEEKMETVHIGVFPGDYEFIPTSRKEGRNIGYISRMCTENGLDILVDAFIELKKDKDFDDVRLILTGGSTGDDTKYLKKIRRKLRLNGLHKNVEFHDDFEEVGLREYFKKVSVISVPVRNGEAFGIYLLEAMASGVPVVQPKLGAFPEIIKSSGGGKIYSPNTPKALAKELQNLLSHPEELDALSKQARKGVEEKFHLNLQVEKMIAVYQKAVEGFKNQGFQK